MFREFLQLLSSPFNFLHRFQSQSPMASLFFLFFLFLTVIPPTPSNAGSWPPSPGYYPSSKFRSMSFYDGYRNLWGSSHQSVDNNGLTMWLDRTSGQVSFPKPPLLLCCCTTVLKKCVSELVLTCNFILSPGSGFKSVKPFRSGYFGASIKLQPGYTAGVITAFYVRIHGFSLISFF